MAVADAKCIGGQTVATLTQSQFSVDDRARVTQAPLKWHVPVRATAGGQPAQLITRGPSNRIEVPGCGTLLINPGQTGYFRTLYRPNQIASLLRAFATLKAADQFGLMTEQLALSSAGYQPMSVGLDMLSAVPANGNAKVVQEALTRWSSLYDELEGQPALQKAIAARVNRKYSPRLRQLGFVPRPGEAPIDTLLRPVLISRLGKFGDPAVVAEAQRLFVAWQAQPDAITGSLKGTWLSVVAGNADATTWEALRRKAQQATGAVERSTLYDLLGASKDQALARRALELALTDEPGKTVSAGIIRSVAGSHPRLAIDFVLANLAEVNQLIDISGRSRFMQRLVEDSGDASLIPTLEAYAAANLAATDRAPINQAIDVIRLISERAPRMRSEVGTWLAANPA
jgi:aminopeptidase N